MQVPRDTYVEQKLSNLLVSIFHKELDLGDIDPREARRLRRKEFAEMAEELGLADGSVDFSSLLQGLDPILVSKLVAGESIALDQLRGTDDEVNKSVEILKKQLKDFISKAGKSKGSISDSSTGVYGLSGNTMYGMSQIMPPLANATMAFERTVMQATRNDAKKALANMVISLNDEMKYQKNLPEDQRTLVEPIGKVINTDDYQMQTTEYAAKVYYKKSQNIKEAQRRRAQGKEAKPVFDVDESITVSKEQDALRIDYIDNGVKKSIFFSEGSYAMAATFKGLMINSPSSSNAAIRGWKLAMNFLRMQYTTLNPYFVLGNKFRDVNESMKNYAMSKGIQYGYTKAGSETTFAQDFSGVFKQIMNVSTRRNYKNSKKEVTILENGKEVTMTIGALAEEAAKEGGFMSMSMMDHDMNARDAKAMNKAMVDRQREKSSNILKRIGLGLISPFRFKRIAEGNTKDMPVLAAIERFSDRVENSQRLALYIMARKQGMTAQQAGQIARNTTLNFEKNGALASEEAIRLLTENVPEFKDSKALKKAGTTFRIINGLYLFINPAIQGGRKTLTKLATPQGRKAMATAAMLSTARNFMLQLMLDEEELKSIYLNDYEINNYYSLPMPGGGTLRINKPYAVDRAIDNLVTKSFGKAAGYRSETFAELSLGLVKETMSTLDPMGFVSQSSSIDGILDVAPIITPSVLQPFMRLGVNKRFNDTRIVSNPDGHWSENYSKSQFENTYRLFGDKNPYRWASEQMYNVFNTAPSPQALEFIKDSYLGQGLSKPFTAIGKGLSTDFRKQQALDEVYGDDKFDKWFAKFQAGVKWYEPEMKDFGKSQNIYTLLDQDLTSSRLIRPAVKDRMNARHLSNLADSFVANVNIGRYDRGSETKNTDKQMKKTIQKYLVDEIANSYSDGLSSLLESIEQLEPQDQENIFRMFDYAGGTNKIAEEVSQRIANIKGVFIEDDINKIMEIRARSGKSDKGSERILKRSEDFYDNDYWEAN